MFFLIFFLSEMKRRERKRPEGKVYVTYFLKVDAGNLLTGEVYKNAKLLTFFNEGQTR